MKYLVLEDIEEESEWDRTLVHILEGENFKEALQNSHFDETLREMVINLREDEPWPRLEDCPAYIPKIRVYELANIPDNKNIQAALKSYLKETLQAAIVEEIKYRAGAEEREKAEQLKKLEAEAKKLGMELQPKKKAKKK